MSKDLRISLGTFSEFMCLHGGGVGRWTEAGLHDQKVEGKREMVNWYITRVSSYYICIRSLFWCFTHAKDSVTVSSPQLLSLSALVLRWISGSVLTVQFLEMCLFSGSPLWTVPLEVQKPRQNGHTPLGSFPPFSQKPKWRACMGPEEKSTSLYQLWRIRVRVKVIAKKEELIWLSNSEPDKKPLIWEPDILLIRAEIPSPDPDPQTQHSASHSWWIGKG